MDAIGKLLTRPRPSTKKAPAKGHFHFHRLNKCPTPPRMSVCMHGTCEAQPTTSTRYRRVVPQKYHCGRPKETKYPPSRIQKAPHGPLSWRQLTSLAPFFLAPECFSPPSRPVPAGLKKMRGAARCAPVKPPRAGPLRLFLQPLFLCFREREKEKKEGGKGSNWSKKSAGAPCMKCFDAVSMTQKAEQNSGQTEQRRQYINPKKQP